MIAPYFKNRHMKYAVLNVALCLFFLVFPQTAFPDGDTAAKTESGRKNAAPFADGRKWSIFLNAGSSLLTDTTDSSYFAETLGAGLTTGYRVSQNMTLLMHAELNTWRSQDDDDQWNSGVFNFGGGIDYAIFPPHVHASFMLGISVLTFDTAIDSAGTTGFFLDFAPIDLRFQFLKRFEVSIFPLSLRLEAPVLHDPPIYYIQYRTVVRVGIYI